MTFLYERRQRQTKNASHCVLGRRITREKERTSISLALSLALFLSCRSQKEKTVKPNDYRKKNSSFILLNDFGTETRHIKIYLSIQQ